MTHRKSRGSSVAVWFAALLFLLCPAEALAQFGDMGITVTDASIPDVDNDGNTTLNLRVLATHDWCCYEAPLSQYIDLGTAYIPGFVFPEWTDCNCNQRIEWANGGWELSEAQEYDGFWFAQVDVSWTLFVTDYSDSDCGACLNCENPISRTGFWEYYGTATSGFWYEILG